MKNLNMLEEIGTKEELVNYFRSLGKNITEEEIENLKKSYEQTELKDDALTLQQLDDVAGGMERNPNLGRTGTGTEGVGVMFRIGNDHITLGSEVIRSITSHLNNLIAEEQTTNLINTDGQTVPQPGQPAITNQETILFIQATLSGTNQPRVDSHLNIEQDPHSPPTAPAA